MRRGNGTGSVSKMSGKRRKPWIVRMSNGIDPASGAPIRFTVGTYATRKEAEAALLSYLDSPTQYPRITLAELYKKWSEWKYKEISKQTADNYRAAWLRLSSLGEMKVKDIRTAHMQEILDNCDKSNSTKQKIRVLCVQLMDYAMQQDVVNKNYAQFLRLKSEEKQEKQIITAIQRQKVARLAAEGDRIMQSILVLCYTGFRINEFLGLTPFSVVRDEGGKPIAFRGGLKTVAGKNRVVPIHAKIQPYLEAWLTEGQPYIFSGKNGARMDAETYRTRFKEAMAIIGADGLTPHATRHTFFSMAAEAGLSQSVTMKIGGHADFGTTLRYTHAEIESLHTEINRIG